MSMLSFHNILGLGKAAAQGIENEDSDVPLDTTRPSVRILSPSVCSQPIGSAGIVIARGIASDDSGISKVEAFSHSFPFDGNFPFRPAIPSAGGDWSTWSIPVQIYENSTRILVRVTDTAGNENWDEVTVDPSENRKIIAIQSHDPEHSVAFVEPSFTDAAYGVGGFYEFYAKHQGVRRGEIVTNYLDLMTAEIPSKLDRAYYDPILQSVRQFLPAQIELTVINDIHVHDGLIFRPDGSNSLRTLFLLHNEYVTQQEYDNLRRFVHNGGTIVFIDSNAFYAEVSYDSASCTTTLVKGHDWEFHKAAGIVTRSVAERYLEENKEWVGTNYMINALWDPVYFSNIPFNYTHFEENYVSNRNATILHNYGLSIGMEYGGEEWHRNETVAAYEMRYGAGKTLGLGIYGQNLSKDPEFLEFFEKVILMHALGNEYTLSVGDTYYPVYWKMKSGQVADVVVDSESQKLVITIQGSLEPDTMHLALPKNLIDVESSSSRDATTLTAVGDSENGTVVFPSTSEGNDLASYADKAQFGTFVVIARLIDGGIQEIGSNALAEYEVDYERIIELPVGPRTSTVEIQSAYVAPEFGTIPASVFITTVLAIASIVLVTKLPWARRLL